MLKHIGLFEGIGGFSLAAKWAGWKTTAWCEINPFCQTVLKYYYPYAYQHSDIKQTSFEAYKGKVDVLTGGFPCQPYSTAGKRKGTEDDRHLWPEMLRGIRECQPRWIVGENVRGLVSWDGGLVFRQVRTDLENEGYEVFPFLLPACGVNAPHRRERIWFVAHSNNQGTRDNGGPIGNEGRSAGEDWRKGLRQVYGSLVPGGVNSADADVTDTNKFNGHLPGLRASEVPQQQTPRVLKNNFTHPTGFRMEGGGAFRQQKSGVQVEERLPGCYDAGAHWSDWPTQSPLCSRNDGLSPRLSGITVSKHRNESIKAYGNAIVPAVAFQIFQAINQYEAL